MSVTRMLVLGVVRIFQPTHGYLVRRELQSWQVAEWAHLNPGSVYNALRVLTKESMLVEEPGEEDTKAGSRAQYRLTVDGEQEFLRLVREGLWELHPYEPGWLLAGLSFWFALTRDEVLAALQARTSLLDARISGSHYAAAALPDSIGTPAHVVESFHLHELQLRAEREWVAGASARIRDGEYGFTGEDPARNRPRGNPMGPQPS
jgi:DNA-binding PadR family transcriptional regulator